MDEMKNYPSGQGMKFVCERIKAKRIAEEAGLGRSIVTSGITHNKVNGNDYYYTDKNVYRLNLAIGKLGAVLKRTVITLDDTTPQQLKEVLLIIRSDYLFVQKMEKNKYYMRNRVTTPLVKFTQEEVETINHYIQEIAEEISNVFLISDKPQE